MRNDFQSNYLAHHGILGQKWGIRRYQNDDGSLTPAGRERYGVGEGKSVDDISTAKGYNRRIKDVKKAIKKNEKKSAKAMTKIDDNLLKTAFGVNAKNAGKIATYSDNIKKGEEEIQRLFARAEGEGYKIGGIFNSKVIGERNTEELDKAIENSKNGFKSYSDANKVYNGLYYKNYWSATTKEEKEIFDKAKKYVEDADSKAKDNLPREKWEEYDNDPDSYWEKKKKK